MNKRTYFFLIKYLRYVYLSEKKIYFGDTKASFERIFKNILVGNA